MNEWITIHKHTVGLPRTNCFLLRMFYLFVTILRFVKYVFIKRIWMNEWVSSGVCIPSVTSSRESSILVIDRWNRIPQHIIIDSASLSAFKFGLDKLKLASIGFSRTNDSTSRIDPENVDVFLISILVSVIRWARTCVRFTGWVQLSWVLQVFHFYFRFFTVFLGCVSWHLYNNLMWS